MTDASGQKSVCKRINCKIRVKTYDLLFLLKYMYSPIEARITRITKNIGTKIGATADSDVSMRFNEFSQ